MTLVGLLREVLPILDGIGCEYFIGGSLASSAWGKQRSTQDADVVAWIQPRQVPLLQSKLHEPLLFETGDLEDGVGSFPSGQILHMDTLDRIDLFAAPSDAYGESQMARRVRVELSPGWEVPIASAEDTVIAKLRRFDLGNRISDRQWNDIVQILEVQWGRLDDAYLDHWTAHFGLQNLLDEARSQVVVRE